MNKIFIQDVVAKMEGKPEQELPADATIRFEIVGIDYEVKVDKHSGRLSVRKSGLNTLDSIIIFPQHPNAVEIS